MSKKWLKYIIICASGIVLLTTIIITCILINNDEEVAIGKDGKSAYQLALDNGYTGSLSEWLESLIGDNGQNGKSAYELAVEKGYKGSKEEWLDSLIGKPGINGQNGKSAYELAVENGFKGTLTDWLLSLTGQIGKDGTDGREVEFQVADGYIQWKYNTETVWKNLVSLDILVGAPGQDGADGAPGQDGTDGREVEFQVADGYIQWKYNTETVWKNLVSLDTLVGAPGQDGADGAPGQDGTDGREVEFQVADGYIQWKYNTDTTWKNLVSLDTLVGAPGQDGADGTPGQDGTDGREVEFQVADGYIQWKYNTDTTWKNLVSLDTITGPKGEDGHTPEITIQNGNWFIDGVDTGIKAKGDQGEDGLSAFEIYKKYHPEYQGTEQEWIESLKGSDGAPGEQGISVVHAYINEDIHLIIVLSNGIEIDAGYVGIEIIKTYTVTFKDYNDSVIETITNVSNGASVTAPKNPVRKGFKFIGWDNEFNNITSNLTVKALYEIDHNQMYFTYAEDGSGNLSVVLSVEGDVNLYGFECKIYFESIGATYMNVASNISGLAVNKNSEYIMLSFTTMDGLNMNNAANLITITFNTQLENVYLHFTLAEVDIFDDDYNDETYNVVENIYDK